MAAGLLMEKCERINSENLPFHATRSQGQDEVPSSPLHEIEKSLKPGHSREPLRRLAQQNWKNLHHLASSTHLSIGASSIRIWQSRCF